MKPTTYDITNDFFFFGALEWIHNFLSLLFSTTYKFLQIENSLKSVYTSNFYLIYSMWSFKHIDVWLHSKKKNSENCSISTHLSIIKIPLFISLTKKKKKKKNSIIFFHRIYIFFNKVMQCPIFNRLLKPFSLLHVNY